MGSKKRELSKGTIIGNEYRIESVLASHDDRSVYVARGVRDPERFVIEVVPVVPPGDRFVSRFARAQQLRSPHLPRLAGIGTLEDGRTYIVVEHLDGDNLKKLVARNPLSLTDAVDFAIEAGHALAAAHAGDVLHGRLRTSSLFLAKGQAGRPSIRVLDVGIAAKAGLAAPDYLAPEQLVGTTTGERPSDIWALGVVMYELVTGRLPFTGLGKKAVVRRVLEEAPPSPRSIRTDLPWQVEQVILRCLEKAPAARFPSVGHVVQALAPFATDRSRALAAQVAPVASTSLSLPPAAAQVSRPPPVPSAPPVFPPFGTRLVVILLGLALVIGVGVGALVRIVQPAPPKKHAPSVISD